MTQLMGVSSNDTMSPCRAKDPDNCRYHKKGSHVPMDHKKMTAWNEMVAAKADSGKPHSLSKKDKEKRGLPATANWNSSEVEMYNKMYNTYYEEGVARARQADLPSIETPARAYAESHAKEFMNGLHEAAADATDTYGPDVVSQDFARMNGRY